MTRNLPEKPPTKWFNSDGSRRRGLIPPTHMRTSRNVDPGHLPPQSGVDRTGAEWIGASRIVDRAKRRKVNRRTWAAWLRRARQAERAKQKAAADG